MPRELDTTVAFRIDAGTRQALRRLARLNQHSLSDELRRAVSAHVTSALLRNPRMAGDLSKTAAGS